MSLIKKALDKAQAEHHNQDHSPDAESSSPFPGVSPSQRASATRGRKDSSRAGIRLVLWSALIVVLSILIGGQLVWLITIFLL